MFTVVQMIASKLQLKDIVYPKLILIILLLLALFIRLPYIYGATIPFMFDHGRDSLAIMEIIRTRLPSLIGPSTSIPGLFFGPGWYYLMIPGYILFTGSPLAPVLVMIFLILVQVWILYKQFGRIEALLIATTPIWIIISKSAWNPYPITLVTILLLVELKNVVKNGILTTKQAIHVGLISSLGFHFLSAFAIFYIPVIAVSLLFRKIRISLRSIAAGVVAFVLLFLPQIIFELRHQFIEIRAIYVYFTSEDISLSFVNLHKLVDTISVISSEIFLSIQPDWGYKLIGVNILHYIALGILGLGIVLLIRKNRLPSLWVEALALLVIPTIGFYFLTIKTWYVLGMIPAVVILAGEALRNMPLSFRIFFCGYLIAGSLSGLSHYILFERKNSLDNPHMLSNKLAAIDIIRQKAGSTTFASYHYLPEIYDYPYQYIYLWQAVNGKPLPTDFSYKPGEIAYLPKKPELLNTLISVESKQPEMIFYIVERPNNNHLVSDWWNSQQYSKIVETIPVSSEITVYKALP